MRGSCFQALLSHHLCMTQGVSPGFATKTWGLTWAPTLGLNPGIQPRVGPLVETALVPLPGLGMGNAPTGPYDSAARYKDSL